MTKIELIDDWRKAWRFLSIQLGIVGSTVAGWLVAFPDHALAVWATLPDDLKAVLPAQYMPLFGVGIFVLSLIARIVKQRKLHEDEK